MLQNINAGLMRASNHLIRFLQAHNDKLISTAQEYLLNAADQNLGTGTSTFESTQQNPQKGFQIDISPEIMKDCQLLTRTAQPPSDDNVPASVAVYDKFYNRLCASYKTQLEGASEMDIGTAIADIYKRFPRAIADPLNLFVTEEKRTLQGRTVTDQEFMDYLGRTINSVQRLLTPFARSVQAVEVLANACNEIFSLVDFDALKISHHALLQEFCNEALTNYSEMRREFIHPNVAKNLERSIEHVFSVQLLSAFKAIDIIKKGSLPILEDLSTAFEGIFYGGLCSPLAIPFLDEAINFIDTKESAKPPVFEKIMSPTLKAYRSFQENDFVAMGNCIRQLDETLQKLPDEELSSTLESTPYYFHHIYVSILNHKLAMHDFLKGIEAAQTESHMRIVVSKHIEQNDPFSLHTNLDILSQIMEELLKTLETLKHRGEIINTSFAIKAFEDMLISSQYLMKALIVTSTRDEHLETVFERIKNLAFTGKTMGGRLSPPLVSLIKSLRSRARQTQAFDMFEAGRADAFDLFESMQPDWLNIFYAMNSVAKVRPLNDAEFTELSRILSEKNR